MIIADRLADLHVCPIALDWVRSHPSLSAESLWVECPRGDWLLYFAARIGVGRGLLVLATCDVARTALVYVPADEPRPLNAIDAAEAWARGEVTLSKVRAVSDAVSDSTYASAFTANAAYAAAYASALADAADPALVASQAATYAAATASVAAAVASYAAIPDAPWSDDAADGAAKAARTRSLRQSAVLVRARIPWTVVAPLWEAGLS